MAIPEGLDIFIHGIPKLASETRLRDCLHPSLEAHGITSYELSKGKNQGYASLYINDMTRGQAFLNAMEKQTTLRLSHKFPLCFRRDSHARDQRFAQQKMAQIDASKTCKIQRHTSSFTLLNFDSASSDHGGHNLWGKADLPNSDSIMWCVGVPRLRACFCTILHPCRSWKASHGQQVFGCLD
jgi:hypothetical protein